MANVTLNLPITKNGYVKASDPYTVFRPNTSEEYRISASSSGNYAMYFGMPTMDSRLRHNKLVSLAFTFAAKFATGAYTDIAIEACNDFDPNTLTYDTRPSVASGSRVYINYSNYTDGVLRNRTTEALTGAALGAYFLKKGIFISAMEVAYGEETGRRIYTKTVLADGSTRPYATVVYDDAQTIKSKVAYKSGPTSGSISSAAATAFAWQYQKATANAYCADETWAQKSAIFYWKKSTENSYHEITISGTATGVTIPTNTFPTGSVIQWYVKGTDEENTTTQTEVFSFSTYATQITPDSYPDGDSVDNRTAKTFTWHFASAGGNYAQQLAALYWRAEGASEWKSIAASGSTQRLSVPAYTFPAGTTIEWYLVGTDASGTGSMSATLSFETLPYSLAISAAPNGSNINTQEAILFAWALSNTQGGAAQKSAVLYWRTQGAADYQTITNSGTTQSLSVPANTFPTASTIQWYLSVTAADGTVLTSNATSFLTVAPKITAQTYPSGNSVDFGSALMFTWIFKTANSSASYPQRSASLFWRASTEDDWSEIKADGTTQRLTVPAYTFPSNSTISWYLQGRDIGGSESTTTTLSFKTVAPQITPQNSPTSGYADPRNAITFSWFFSTGSNNYPQQSADFYWRVEGQTEWQHVAAEGSAQSVTIPANTFPLLQNIEWYLTGTDIGGTYSETQIYTFSTTASTAYAVCMDPVGKAADGAKPITLKWIVRNDDGSVATRTIVRWKLPTESQSEWHEIIDTTDSITEYTVAENTFPAGPIEWLVIAYNRDDVAGPESQASFVCVVAPDAPSGLTATAVPLTEIRWQSTGQEAYEVSIDGEVVKEGFGTDVYSYRVTEPLADGAHSIAVRIQGRYSLWSEAAETQIFVSNAPKGAIALSGEFGVDAELFWTYDGEDDPETVAIYRDGKWIGTATGADRFLDRYVLGTHEYRVEYWFADGNYTRSETVSGTMSCRTMMIANIDGGPWLELGLSENEIRTMSFTRRRDSELSHITARKFPVLEISDYEELIGKFDCAFRWPEDAMEFERLFGRVVILKTRDGTVISGGLTETGRKVANLYIGYTFSIEQNDVEDFVRHDTND